MEEIEKLANKSREAISDYCINECHSFCCRKGYLIVAHELGELMAGNEKELLIKEKSMRELIDGKYSMNFENSLGGCPALKDFKCTIHKNKDRSITCKDFPIFILGNQIKISNRCPAKKDNKFFEFEKKAKELGFEIVDEFFRI